MLKGPKMLKLLVFVYSRAALSDLTKVSRSPPSIFLHDGAWSHSIVDDEALSYQNIQVRFIVFCQCASLHATLVIA